MGHSPDKNFALEPAPNGTGFCMPERHEVLVYSAVAKYANGFLCCKNQPAVGALAGFSELKQSKSCPPARNKALWLLCEELRRKMRKNATCNELAQENNTSVFRLMNFTMRRFSSPDEEAA